MTEQNKQSDAAAPETNVMGEPTGYLVNRYDLGGVLLDTELSFTKPVIRSTSKTEFVPLFASPAPHDQMVGTIDCPCTTFEQDEDCPVGYPSLLCAACDGKGIAPIDKVVAFAAEMMKVAEQVDELEDPFAAWETIDLIKSQHRQLRAALKPFAAAPYTGPNSFNRAALSDDDFRQARHILATTEGLAE